MGTVSGRRKEATAVVKLTKGTGIVTVNKKSIDEYFGRDVAKMIVRQPLVLTQRMMVHLMLMQKFKVAVLSDKLEQ